MQAIDKEQFLIIDYVSLAMFWAKLTEDQRNLIKRDEINNMSINNEVSVSSVLGVYRKLTDSQKDLIENGYFCGIIQTPVLDNIDILAACQLKYEGIDKVHGHITSARIKREKTPPPPATENSKTMKLAKRFGTKCWYTGEECFPQGNNKSMSLTEEHLISVKYGGRRRNGNIVVSSYFMNNIVNCAPIHAKIKVKQELDRNAVDPNLPILKRIKHYRKIANKVLKTYELFGKFPWDDPSRNNRKKFNALTQMQGFHLDIQNKFIERVENSEYNIREYIKEKCNGMELG